MHVCNPTFLATPINLYNKTRGPARPLPCILPLQWWFKCYIIETNPHTISQVHRPILQVILSNSLISNPNHPHRQLSRRYPILMRTPGSPGTGFTMNRFNYIKDHFQLRSFPEFQSQ